MFKVYVLVKNLDSDHGVHELRFSTFTLTKFRRLEIEDHRRLASTRRLFPAHEVDFDDWLYERIYHENPPSRTVQDVGFGDAPAETEDVLLALKLFKAGDISFVGQVYEQGGEIFRQRPYRFFGNTETTFPYSLLPSDVGAVDELLSSLKSPTAASPWFRTAARFLLYGGAKEFNPRHQEIDRVVDLCVALEAVLMHEKEFVTRLSSQRAQALLSLAGSATTGAAKLVREFYGYRSSVVHGNVPEFSDPEQFENKMRDFESLVREVLRSGLARIPVDAEMRKEFLNHLASISESDREDFIREKIKGLQPGVQRTRLLTALSES